MTRKRMPALRWRLIEAMSILSTVTLVAVGTLLAMGGAPAQKATLEYPNLGWTVETWDDGRSGAVYAADGTRYPIEPVISSNDDSGETVPVAILTSPADVARAYVLELDGIDYRVCSDGTPDPDFPGPVKGTIKYIDTSDPHFSSPEGVSLGTTLGSLVQQYQVELRDQANWGACFVCLPSGWAAAFPYNAALGPLNCDRQVRAGSEVSWFFKKRSSCGK